MKNNRLRIVLALFSILFVACFGYYYWKDTKTIEVIQSYVSGDIINISVESGLYDEAINISMAKNHEYPHSAKIYYTLDGNDPTAEDIEYDSEIELKPDGSMTVYPLKAVVYHNGEYSSIVEKTYILCSDKSNEYDLNIVSITSDEYNLYDYEYGILVAGKTYDDNIAAGGGENSYGNYNNRGDEWIRQSHIAMFDKDGGLVLEQNAGLEVSGGTSSAYTVKSLELHSDTVYDAANDKFELSLINEGAVCSSFSFLDSYNSIKLRSGSQDQSFGNIRSSVVSRLAEMSGFDGCTTTNRCIVYLNGKFYGIFDMQQNYSRSYLANQFGLESSDYIVKNKANEEIVLSACGLTEYFNADLNDEANRELLEQYVDMDNFLLYYAIEILCNNTDWPGNNFLAWHYTGEYDPENKYTDGRWRFIIFDTDLTFSTNETPLFFEGCTDDIFESLMMQTNRGKGSLFGNIMESECYRNKFTTLVCDLLNTSFSRENILDVVKSENQKIKYARKEFYDSEIADKSEFYVTELMSAAIKRPEQIKYVMKNYFGLADKYFLKLKASEGVKVYWNNMKVFSEEEYSNNYYRDVEFTLSQEAYPGYIFEYWMVNGEKIYTPELIVSEELINEDTLCIEAVARRQDTEVLIISELSAKGDSDWIRLTNAGDKSISIHNYYISDNPDLLSKYQLPELVLCPEESVIIYGSKNYNSLGDYICNFSLSRGETLLLSKNSELYDSVVIPDMSNSESYGRYDNSNDWVYYNGLIADNNE